ncbi:MAG: hypothetical protein KME12_17995 [Trichocoleus desertorum ATA4-8-CV12]|nr:hypothetical protein [Trichocoleus desertorum ATA4-8-CV12]
MSNPILQERELSPESAEAPCPLKLSLSLPLAPDAASLLEVTPPATSRIGLRAIISRFWSKEVRTQLRKLAPWLVSGAILGLNLILHAPLFILGATIAALTLRIVKGIIRSSPLCQKLWSRLLAKTGIPEHKLPWLSTCFASGAWFSATAPSQALFFNTAEQYVQQLFAINGAQGVDTFIPLIFGTLRVIFCIYIGIALIRVINAFRNDEDWTTAARIPLIVVLCIVMGDALTTLITS